MCFDDKRRKTFVEVMGRNTQKELQYEVPTGKQTVNPQEEPLNRQQARFE